LDWRGDRHPLAHGIIWAFIPIPTPSGMAAIQKRRKKLVSIAVSLLIGSSLLGGVIIIWNQAAPMSSRMFLRRHVLQVMPDVREFVSKVYVEPDQRVKKGDPLFEIRPDRFQDAVDEASSQLAAAKATVSQLEASVEAGEAAVKKSTAATATAKAELDTAMSLQKDSAGAIAKLRVVEAQQGFRAAQADGKVKKAALKQTRFSLAAAQHSVDVSQAALNSAEFNRKRCTYISPVDGQVVNWQVNEGTPAARWRFTASGTVMDLSDSAVVAIFPQWRQTRTPAPEHQSRDRHCQPWRVIGRQVDDGAQQTESALRRVR
jgi:multidrug resistance efflux pump